MTYSNNMYENYKNQSILTMTQSELLIKLYDELSLQLNLGIKAIDDKNYEKANNALFKSQKMITYLNATLNHKYPVAANLEQLYEFFNRQLLHANMTKNKNEVAQVLDMVNSLRDAWKQADKLSRVR